MAKSKLDAPEVVAQLRTWLEVEGKSQEWVAQQLGVGTSSIKRAIRRHGIEPVEVIDASALIDRVEREAAGAATVEDRLRSDLDHAVAEKRRLESALKRKLTEEKFEDRVIDAIKYHVAEPYVPPMGALTAPKPASNTRPQHFVGLISDAHGGEVVDAEEALGIKYNWDICVRRMEHIRDTYIKYAELRPYEISKLWLPVLGDMVSGSIHDELENTNEKTLPEQAIEMGRVLFQMGVDLASYFPEVEMVILPGNHPRTKLKQSNKKRATNNMEFVMGHFTKGLAEAAKVPNLKVEVPKDLVKVIDVLGHRIGLMHGDGVKSNNFAGIPFYGLKQRRDALQTLLDTIREPRLKMLAMGHFHQYVYWRGNCDVIINPSIKGGDEYSIANYLAIHLPEQILLEFHEEHGLTSQNLISLGHIQ